MAHRPPRRRLTPVAAHGRQTLTRFEECEMRLRTTGRAVAAALGCLALAGCVARTEGAEGVTVRYQWWVPALLLVGGIVAVPAGWWLRRRVARLGWAMLILGPVSALLFAPSLLAERVRVTQTGFSVNSGIWGMTANLEVPFDSVTRCRIAQEKTTGRRPRAVEVLYFSLQGGRTERLELNNDIKIDGGQEIVNALEDRDVPVDGYR